MRTDWLLNDDGVLNEGSDWFRDVWAKSEMEELPKFGLKLLKLETHHIDYLFHKH